MSGSEPSNDDAPIRVLQVDDDRELADLTATFVEREDDRFVVETATSAQAGLDRLSSSTFDCVVSDHEMPGMSGLAFLEAVRDRWPDLPFILFTGRGSEEIASEAISAGVSDYLQKTPGREQYELLANRIRTLVERTRARLERDRQLDAIETAREGIGILDGDGRFVYVNEAYADLYGYGPERLVGEHWSLLYPDDDVDVIEREVLPKVEANGTWRGETTGLRLDGTTFVEDHTLSRTDDGGLVCTVRDITNRREQEQILRRYKVIVEAIDDAIYVLDQDERLEYVNDAYADLKGVPRADLIGTPIDRWADEAVLTQTRAMLAEMEAGNREIGKIAYDFRTGSGETIPVELRFTRLEFPDGRAGRVGVIRDISDQWARERELERYETILEALGDPVYAADRDGRYVFVNDAYLEQPFIAQRGLDREDLLGRHATTVLPEETVDTIRTEIQDLIADDGREKTTVETDRVAPEGSHRAVETHIALLPPDEDGRFRGTAGVIRDITERIERERELEQLWERLKLALGGTRAWLWEVDLETGTTTQIAVSGLLAGDEEELVRPVDDFHASIHPGDRDRVRRAFWRAADEAAYYHEEYRLPVDGDHRWIESRGCFHADAPDVSGRMIGIAIDVSERKDRERALERQNERLEEFASIVSHDLRNPLNVANGRMAIALEECACPHLEAIDRAHERMESLIDNLLTLARSGGQVEAVAPVDLAELCDVCWRNVDTGEASLSCSVDRSILADRSRLQQVLENLYRNAVEHGGRAVAVDVGGTEDGFYVADDGPGIPPTEREAVFESGYSSRDGNTGFGLSIVKSVAEAHDWDLTVVESVTGGARFEFSNVAFADDA